MRNRFLITILVLGACSGGGSDDTDVDQYALVWSDGFLEVRNG